MLVLGGKAKNEEEARVILKGHLEDGSALAKPRERVEAGETLAVLHCYARWYTTILTNIFG
ncbi:hypothetical protein [Paenibacillus macquariensis]|uniref:Uncharacterized protein n=1 Tax=Paenibacillus macquariensis TaxID=948756 RepID=A0ABY1JJZ4_9BACL|nr:hypothetical protein [Paenibacillus macquariensis]MEC0089829.1 hypothetical protein [Paenibacillus macquariensis]OAB30704.1 hypothetical protein PMSM_21405 [Paenibacillus macquariensis subsp. macquariensis]SIQ32135.1 hypothetical protein SAMN05421578_101208 [Paenibacillus macquariensis]